MKTREKQIRNKKEGRALPTYAKIRAEVLRKRKEKRE
jgi:hypothetical protein